MSHPVVPVRRPALALCPALCLAALAWAAWATGEELTLTDSLDQEVQVETLPADGDLLVLWPQDLERDRPGVVRTLAELHAAGIEVWLTNPLDAAFLPRSNEVLRTLPGASIAALIEAALAQSPRRVLLLGHDRMALPLLRGLHQWQAGHPGPTRLAGAVLLYPNLFGPAPAAGDEPELDPIVRSTGYPTLILQPELGALRRRMGPVFEALWQGGAPAFVRLVPGVRDWYPMEPPGEDLTRDAAVARLPAELAAAARLLAATQAAVPAAVDLSPQAAPLAPQAKVLGLVQRPATAPPGLRLRDGLGRELGLPDLKGSVVLVNFWATWCPPCVEEIPSMNRLAARFSPGDFRIVSVNFREGAEQVLGFMRRVHVDFPVLLDDDGRVSGDWQVFAFPSSFLVDRAGRVRYSVNNAIAWDDPEAVAVIEALVAEPAAPPPQVAAGKGPGLDQVIADPGPGP